MDIRLIGTIRDTKDNIIGLRLLELDEKNTKDVTLESAKDVLSWGSLTIVGLELRGESVAGTNGKLDRYPRIVNGKLHGKSPLIILMQYTIDGDVVGYKVSDWKGSILNLATYDVVEYAKDNGISNGAIKDLGHKEIVSSIHGEYVRLETASKKSSYRENEAYMDDVIWTLEDFDKFMRDNKYEYTIKKDIHEGKDEIRFHTDMEIIKYPNSIETINRYFDGRAGLDSLKVLIMSPSIKEVKFKILNSSRHLEKIVIQEGAESIRANGIVGGESPENANSKKNEEIEKIGLKEIVFPRSMKEIYWGFTSLPNITDLKLCNTQLNKCVSSFNNLYGIEYLDLPNTLEYIKDSFNNLNHVKDIRMPDNLKILTGVNFTNLGVSRLELSNCSELKEIGYKTFSECNNLRVLALPEGVELIERKAFSNCRNLTLVDFPIGLKSLRDYSFENSLIDEFRVHRSLGRIGVGALNKFTKIIIDDDVEKIPGWLMRCTKFNRVEISKNVELIGEHAFDNCDINSIVTKNDNINEEDDGIGEWILDLEGNIKLKKIDKKAFANNKFSIIILPEGLERIRDGCFMNCKRLRHIVLPRGLKGIGSKAFDNAGKDTFLGTLFHVYDKSFGKRYCERHGYKHITMDSIDEFHGYINSKDNISEIKKAKLKLLLSSDDLHKRLMEPGYINNAEELLKIYNYMEEELENSDAYTGMALDTGKFVEVDVNSISMISNTLKEIKEKERKKGHDMDKLNIYNGKLTRRFVNLSNLITKIFEFKPLPFTPRGLEYMEDRCYVSYNTIYTDKFNSIIRYDVKYKDDSNFDSLLLVIVMDNRIRFVTAIDKNVQMPCYGFLNRGHTVRSELKKSIVELLRKGDTLTMSESFGSYSTIRGCDMPRYIYSKTLENMNQHLIILGHENIENKLNSEEDKSIKLDLMCRDTGKIIKTQSRYVAVRFINDIRDIKDFLVTDVMDLKDIDDDIIKRLMDGIEYERTDRLFRKVVEGDEYLSNLMNLPGAYDSEPIYEWELSQALHESGVKEVGDLNSKAFELYMDTVLFTKKKMTLGKALTIGKMVNETEIDGGKYKIIEIKLNKSENNSKIPRGMVYYTTGLVENTDNHDNSTKDFYASYDSFSNSFRDILKMKKEGDVDGLVSDDSMTYDDVATNFVNIQRQLSSISKYGAGYSFSVDIHKGSGGVFMLGRVEYDLKIKYFKIFRFKCIEDALRHTQWMIKMELNNEERIELIQYTEILGAICEPTKGRPFNSDKMRMRNAIINGIPNKHYINVADMEFFDVLAKQPKQII